MSNTHFSQQYRRVDQISSEGITYITAVGLLITGLFTVALFKNLSIETALSHVQHEYLQATLLAFYYYCWVFGTKFDLTMQKSVYLNDPTGRTFPLSSILVVAALAAIAITLFAVKDYPRWFAGFLLLLLILNVIAWLHLLSRILPIIKASANAYRSDQYYFGLERLHLVVSYINGSWQWYRFIGMALIIAVLLLVSFVDSVSDILVGVAHAWLPTITPAVLSSLIPDVVLLAFIAFAESWIWLQRAKTKTFMRFIDSLDEDYILNPNPERIKAVDERFGIHDRLKWWRSVRLRVTASNPLKRKKPGWKRRREGDDDPKSEA